MNKLNTSYKLYFHDPNSYNWEIDSYILINSVNTIEDFWMVNSLIEKNLHLGMFFLMRENIFPLWDSENNNFSFSFKILKNESIDYWTKISIMLLSESFLKKEHINLWKILNGISISPKKNFCIIKLWLNNNNIINEQNIKDYFKIPEEYKGNIIIRNY
jgi:hypothetical protein|tara:strand:- start:1453 stop:1929 length:477 start_codon:yes stop_codon:yes gene_type:complete